MNKAMKRLALSIGVALALSSGAATASIDEAISNISAKLKADSPQLANATFVVDKPIAEMFQKKTKTNYVPFSLSGQLFVTDGAGEVLIKPDGFFLMTEDGLQRAQDVINYHHFAQPENRDWPSLKVKDGVEKKGDLYVLTDPTCGYCQKMDAEAPVYAANGIELHYIPYPRMGLNPNNPGYQQWVAAACAEDPALAYNEIIMGTDAGKYKMPTDPNAECVNLVSKGYEFGRKIGMTGTPYLYGESVDGRKFTQPGFIEASKAAMQLGVVLKKDNGSSLLK